MKGVEGYKKNIHGRLILKKGEHPPNTSPTQNNYKKP